MAVLLLLFLRWWMVCVWIICSTKLEQRRLPWQRFSSFSYRSETLPPHNRRHDGGHMRYDYPGDRSGLPSKLTCAMSFSFYKHNSRWSPAIATSINRPFVWSWNTPPAEEEKGKTGKKNERVKRTGNLLRISTGRPPADADWLLAQCPMRMENHYYSPGWLAGQHI